VAAGHAARDVHGDAIFEAIPALGEDGSQVDDPAQGGESMAKVILKRADEQELKIYQSLSDVYGDDPVHPFIPAFKGIVSDVDAEGHPRKFLCMTNLLHGFQNPNVMDVKLGTRTFLESECTDWRKRPDLYRRMLDLFPSHITEEEHAAQSVTKHKWMSLRDSNSTSSTLGFRIDGQWKPDDPDTLTNVHSLDEASKCFKRFICTVGCELCEGDENSHAAYAHCSAGVLATRITEEMERLRAAMEASRFLRRHECIGSSILLVADRLGRAGAFWIDFAKTSLCPKGVTMTHRKPWKLGNHEDGVLTGVDNLVHAWTSVAHQLRPSEDDPAASIRTNGSAEVQEEPSPKRQCTVQVQ